MINKYKKTTFKEKILVVTVLFLISSFFTIIFFEGMMLEIDRRENNINDPYGVSERIRK